jgi:sterol desaturase/sphingolipid hydroxylase (fatty acid hydroxylase superfamily)
MFFLQFAGWFVFGCLLNSFVEHQFHRRFMHRRNFLSDRYAGFKRIFESHAIVHHQHYSEEFCDEPVPVGEDKEIRLGIRNGVIRTSPIALVIAFFSLPGALAYMASVYFHHFVWNQIHLEMHKPEHKFFSNWPIYKFLARHHCLHHIYPDKNFNVVFPFADYVLGTNVHPTAEDLQYMRQLGLR